MHAYTHWSMMMIWCGWIIFCRAMRSNWAPFPSPISEEPPSRRFQSISAAVPLTHAHKSSWATSTWCTQTANRWGPTAPRPMEQLPHWCGPPVVSNPWAAFQHWATKATQSVAFRWPILAAVLLPGFCLRCRPAASVVVIVINAAAAAAAGVLSSSSESSTFWSSFKILYCDAEEYASR